MNAELPKLFEHSLTLRGAIGLGLQAVLDAAKDAGFAVEVTDVKLVLDKPEQNVPFVPAPVKKLVPAPLLEPPNAARPILVDQTGQTVQNAAAALRP